MLADLESVLKKWDDAKLKTHIYCVILEQMESKYSNYAIQRIMCKPALHESSYWGDYMKPPKLNATETSVIEMVTGATCSSLTPSPAQWREENKGSDTDTATKEDNLTQLHF